MKKPKLTPDFLDYLQLSPRERLGRKIIRLTAIRDKMFQRWKMMDIEDSEVKK